MDESNLEHESGLDILAEIFFDIILDSIQDDIKNAQYYFRKRGNILDPPTANF